MSEALEAAKAKDAIINARGESKVVAVGTRKYVVHLKDGSSFTCIDLMKDDPDEVERLLRQQFGRRGVERIDR